MKFPRPRAIVRRIKRLFEQDPDRFLRSVSGVIHVGANTGQERDRYERLGLCVLWIEPIPTVFQELLSNISQLPRQRAIQALVTDRDNETCEFHVSNNNGASSSILDLHKHKDIWPDVEYTETLQLESATLPSVLQEHEIDPSPFNALVMDTQGSELLVLKGAEALLKQFSFVKTEVADFESYVGCCQLVDLDAFMTRHGFRMFSKHPFAHRNGGGTYYDVTYQRRA